MAAVVTTDCLPKMTCLILLLEDVLENISVLCSSQTDFFNMHQSANKGAELHH